jgi:hypothetical protein
LRRRVFWLLLAVLLSAGGAVHSEEQSTPAAEEYSKEEFSQAARDLRRFEILLFGSFPLTLFLSLEVYDFYRFANSGWDSAYAPWPLRPPAAAAYADSESAGILVAAVTFSAALALADYVIGRLRERRAENPNRHDH